VLGALASAAAVLLAAGCGDNKRRSATSADLESADPTLLARAVGAASGADALAAWDLAQQLASSSDPSGCPRVEQQGDTTVITGDCDGAAGRIAGRVVVETASADRTALARVSFEGFADLTRAIEGTIERSPDGSSLSASLSIDQSGILVASSLSLTCDGRSICAAGDDTWVDVDGLGTVDVLGAWRTSPAGGYLTLVGAQTLTLDLNALADGCIPYTLDGAPAGALCE